MKGRPLAIAVLSFLGMIDALYLSIKHGSSVPCTITHGCEQVLTSRFAEIQGLPISWIGLAFYLTVFCCAVFELFDVAKTMRLVFWLGLAAFLISLVLVGLQAFVIQAYCQYCLGSALLVTSIFLVSAWKSRQTAYTP
jgi:uncharacterized membrane protein